MYIVIEQQQLDESTLVVVTPIPTAETEEEALAIYYEKMSYVMRSALPCHSVVVLRNDGLQIAAGHHTAPKEAPEAAAE